MDKYEYKVRADEIKDLIAQGEYVQAAEIADTIDWRRVKSVMMLCTISDLYKINRRYEDARNMLLLAYERRPGGRTICYSLCELSIKMEDFVPAVNYYKEFVQVAPKDPGRYILQYKLYEAQDVSLEERIGVLEELKKRDYREKWAYELAYLYHRVGLGTRCVEECDELILWFGEGKYVIKAMELKMLHQSLTPSQQEKYDHRFEEYGQNDYGSQQAEVSQKQPYYGGQQEPAPQEQLYYEPSQEPVVQEPFYYETQQEPVSQEQFYYETQQEPVSQEQFYYETQQEPVSQEPFYYETLQGTVPQEPFYYETQQEPVPGAQPYYQAGQEPALQGPQYYTSGQEQQTGYNMSGKTQIYGAVTPQQLTEKMIPAEQALAAKTAEEPVPEELDIQVKTMDMGQYNTINLQAEIAAGLREVLEDDQKDSRENAITRSIMAPMLESETESLDLPEIDEVNEEDLEPEAEVMEDSEVFFGETGEIGDIQAGGQTFFGKEAVKEIVPEIGSVRRTAADGFDQAAAEEGLDRKLAEVNMAVAHMPERTVKSAEVEAEQSRPEPAASREPQRAETEQSGPKPAASREPQGAEAEQSGPKPAASQEPQRAEAEQSGPKPAASQEPQRVETEQSRPEPAAAAEQQRADDTTAETVMAQLKRESRAEEQVLIAQPPKEIASVLSQESDGQISLVVPESEQIEKQITGQMNLEDILREWERMKQENAEKRKEEVRQHVLQHTGEMFTAFEASVRDGLLEQLESGNADVQDLTEEAVAEDVAEPMEESFDEETGQEVPVEEAEADGLEENEDWDSQPREEPEELETLLKEAEKEVIFGDSDEVEEIEEIEEPQETNDTEELEADEEEWMTGSGTDEPEEAESPEEEPEEPVEQDSQPEEPDQSAEEEAETAEKPEAEETESAESERSVEQDTQTKETEKAAKKKPKTETGTAGEDKKQLSVEREKGKVRSLTKEEKELYGPYIQSRASREQLVQAIDNISMAAYTGNIIITGEEGMDTVSLAKNMIREIQMTDSNFAGKVAKISGQALNKKDVESTIHQLASGALIIQKASGMDADTAKRLHKALQQESFGIIIILEDVKKAMNKFLKQHSELAVCFTARMDVESLSNGTLVAFGRKYAREREYSIDDMGILALHTRIDEMQTSDHVVTVLEVKELVDSAIKHANRKNLKHFFDILLAKRYDEEDMIILSERDFV